MHCWWGFWRLERINEKRGTLMSEGERSYKRESIEVILRTMLATDDLKVAVDKFKQAYELLTELYIDQIFKISGEE